MRFVDTNVLVYAVSTADQDYDGVRVINPFAAVT